MCNYQTNSRVVSANATGHERFNTVTYLPQRADALRPFYLMSCLVAEIDKSTERFLKAIKSQKAQTYDDLRNFSLSTNLYFLAKIFFGSDGIFCWKYLSECIRPTQFLATGQLFHFGHAAEKAIDNHPVCAETLDKIAYQLNLQSESLCSIHAKNELMRFGSSDDNGLFVRGGA
jgi:hypothetical protein